MENSLVYKYMPIQKPVKPKIIKTCTWCGQSFSSVEKLVDIESTRVKDGMLWFDCSCSSRLFLKLDQK